MTVIVTGSRDWRDDALIAEALGQLRPRLVVQGGAKGADDLAACWARASGIEVRTFAANWKRHGRRAGILRNVEMLEAYPNATVVAFSLGTPGTEHMIRDANRRGHVVLIYRSEPSEGAREQRSQLTLFSKR